MIRSLYRTQDGHAQFDMAPEEFTKALQDPSGLLWVDFEGESPTVCEPIMRDVFGFHPLAVDDALAESHVPKVDDWDDYVYVVLHGIVFDTDDDHGEHVDTLEIDVFLGRNYIVTHHDFPIAAVERVWDSCHRDERHLRKGADYLAYRLADELVADYMPAVEELEEAIDRLEDQVFAQPTTSTLQHIFSLKRALLSLRRIAMPQREVLNKLARGDFAVIDNEGRVLFRDVYDHLVRLNDINENLRDLLSGTMDIYLSVINNRMNDSMKTLTAIATLFMPLSFVAGFFGMNFFQPVANSMRVWTGELVLGITLAVMLLIPLGMYLWIRRRGWM
jgi:magnesium transporter